MINFEGYDNIIAEVHEHSQDHVFHYWNGLNDDERGNLLKELSGIDFNLMKNIFLQSQKRASIKINFSSAPYISLPKNKKEILEFEKAAYIGTEYIRCGKIAALLAAGGQGTRLGFDGPKGMCPVGPVSSKPLFRVFAEKIIKYSRKYDIAIPWYIMTSKGNNQDTIDCFEKNKYFGLEKNLVRFFTQNMIPSLDTKGKLILRARSSLFMNPDGHGGTLTALSNSGILHEMKKSGIETISYFQVDNPLVKIIDPVFIGFHILNNSDVSSKGLMKTSSQEKVGVFVKYENGKTGVMEYSDLTPEEQNAADENGDLLFRMGNPAIHIFRRVYIETITQGKDLSLPYHLAMKKINAFIEGREIEITGYKYEKFIFDALTLTDKNTILETKRDEEFAPVKNSDGVDSVKSSKKLMHNLHKKWLEQNNINIPNAVKIIEISPLLAVEPDDLKGVTDIPKMEKIYLE